MAKPKPKGKKPKLFSPFLLMIAAMAAWAATHVPAQFADVGAVGGWALSAIAVGLGARAVLALVLPLLELAETLCRARSLGRDEGADT